MEEPYDTYPEDSDRRRFVKGVVGAGALSGVIGAGTSFVDIATTPGGAGGGPTQYMGIELVGGPAPRGMPTIPVELDEEGFLRGIWPDVEMVDVGGQQVPVASMTLGGQEYNTIWYQYCGSQNNPAVEPDADRDNYFRYRGGTNYQWQGEAVSEGDRVNIEHFQDYDDWGNVIGEGGLGKPADVTWRSTDLEPRDRLPIQLIRSPLIAEQASYEPDGQLSMEERQSEDTDWISASTAAGFVAVHNQCTHFCCVPGYKNPEQPDAAAYDAEDNIYCQCHQSVYDPFSIVRQSMVALPRSD